MEWQQPSRLPTTSSGDICMPAYKLHKHQRVSSGLSHLIKRVVWARCGRRKSLSRYAAENRRRGCCFYKSEQTESDWYTASPYGLVDLQLPPSSDRGYHIPSQCLLLWCTLHKWYSHAPQPCAPTVDHQPAIRTRINKLAFCSSLTTSTLVAKLYYNRLILSDSERTASNTYDDDDCFYYHSWRNNVVFAFRTLSSFLT